MSALKCGYGFVVFATHVYFFGVQHLCRKARIQRPIDALFFCLQGDTSSALEIACIRVKLDTPRANRYGFAYSLAQLHAVIRAPCLRKRNQRAVALFCQRPRLNA